MANEFKIRKGLIVEGALGGTVVDVLGSQGQLLSVTDNLSGSIFAVSDISGVPILDVNSSGIVNIDGTLNINNKAVIEIGPTSAQATDYLYIGGDGLASADAAIYIGNKGDGQGYGYRIYYSGTGSGVNNKLILKSENIGTNIDMLTFTADGNATFSGNVTTGASLISSNIIINQITARTANGNILVRNNAGSNIVTFNNNLSSTFAGDVTVSGGDITLSGTGRIQGVDTVSASTDAANKAYVDAAAAGVPIGNYLPLSAGSTKPLTGDLFINKTDPGIKLMAGTQDVAWLGDFGGGTDGQLVLFNNAGAVRVALNGQADSYFNGGNIAIGGTSNSAEDTNNGVPKFQVNTTTAVLGEFPLAARFTTNSDAGNDSGVSVLINSGNDRGLMISAGRQTGNVAKVTLNVVENTGTELSGITILQNGSGGTSANVGIGAASPETKLTVENASGGPASTTYATTASKANLHLSAVGVPFYNHLFMGIGSATYAWIQAQHGNSIAQNLALNPIGGNVGIGTTTPNAKLDIKGTQGQLFSVTDDLSGEIFAVADISGVPIMAVNSSGVSYFDGKVFINAIASIPNRTEEFQVTGRQIITNTGTNSAALYLGYNSSGSNTIQLGRGRTADGLSYIDLNGEVMSAGDYGFRIMRRAGVNAVTDLIQVGTGNLTINASNGANTVFTNTNVGIGTTGPAAKLHVKESSGSTSQIKMSAASNEANYGYLTMTDNTVNTAKLTFGTTYGYNTPVPAMTVWNGMVGIGTTSPLAGLDISNTNASIYQQWSYDNPGANNYNLQLTETVTSGNVRFVFDQKNAGTQYSDVLVFNQGKIGIGTDEPGAKLEVNGDTLLGATDKIGWRYSSGNTSYNFITGEDQILTLSGGTWTSSATQTAVRIKTIQGEKVTIRNNGDVGIGTTSPDAKFEVAGGTSGIRLSNVGDSGAYDSIEMTYNGYNSGIPEMKFRPTQTPGSGIVNSYFRFINSNGNSTTANNYANVSIDGSLGINDLSPSYKLDVKGTIRATGDIIAYSDARVKENIKTIDNALNKIDKLRGVEFNKIGEDIKSIGVIAQEIEKVIPEVVREDDKGMKSVAYGNISGLLIEAIKELKAEIDLLKSKPCTCNKCNCNI